MGDIVVECLYAYLNKREDLSIKSAELIEILIGLWHKEGLSDDKVFDILNERINLSNKLLEEGIRARKGQGYPTTKLP